VLNQPRPLSGQTGCTPVNEWAKNGEAGYRRLAAAREDYIRELVSSTFARPAMDGYYAARFVFRYKFPKHHQCAQDTDKGFNRSYRPE
jgi:hypothetical protein